MSTESEETFETFENGQPEDRPEKAEIVIAKISDKGHFSFENHLELATSASMMIQTQMAPESLRKEGKHAVMAALVLCKQYNLPQKAMNQMAFIKGRLTCWGSLVTALAERHKDYGDKREFFVDEGCEEICTDNKNLKAVPWAAVVQIKKKDSDTWNEYFFSMDDAKLAGLDNPKKRGGETNLASPWIKYVKDMLKHKARKRALESEYASALEGIEYFEDVREIIDINPVPSQDGDVAAQISGVLSDDS